MIIFQLERVIHNKNVNVIVNLDPKNVALELWKLMRNRISNNTRNFISEQNIIDDLETAVMPFVTPSRRTMTPLYAYQVATDLDQIIRTAFIRNFPNMNLLDVEVTTRNIVANMMATLKILVSRNSIGSADDDDDADVDARLSGRRMIHAAHDDSRHRDDYVDVQIKIRRKDILDALQ